ncbi:hypothetical protein AB0M86_29530 [Streptomyces sp. NPDC051639]|uniref:hypothetical protein n=1 Tax=Streptomyces sp. NPDC051639 TaxID=3155671 RepID=UPI0034170CF9
MCHPSRQRISQTAPQQLHRYFDLVELDEVEARWSWERAKPDHQPREAAKAWILTDPAGHPFCICRG